MQEAKGRITELDALRGLAALLVVQFHYTMHRPASEYFGELGITGVDLFFIISGFVIYKSLAHITTWWEFMQRRIIRLYPAYLVIVSFTALLTVFNFAEIPAVDDQHINLWKYLANLSMFQYYFRYSDLDGPYWTLLVEMQFYVLIALALWLKQIRRILLIGAGVLAVPLFVELVLMPLDPETSRWSLGFFKEWVQILGHFPFFFAGMLFYRMFTEGKRWFYGLGILVCYLAALLAFDNTGRAENFIALPQYIFTTSVYFLLFFFLIQRKLGFLARPIPLFFGRISYSLYLIHQFLGADLIIPYLEKHFGIHYLQGALIAFSVAVGLAYLVTRYVEEPMIARFRK
jgi:peptidoglycan/LPS O-acetylase OafA/YrhL